ncbi:hypothetical protein KR074_000731, partial [Drosophila pseudoananassae]
ASPDASTNYSLWKLTSRFKRQVIPKAPLRNPAGGWCRSSQQKADIFADNLENRFKPLDLAPLENRMFVETQLDRPFQMALPCKPVTLEEVKAQIGNLKNKKAPGEDLLDNKTLKILPIKALLFIVLLFNSVLRLSHYPRAWKNAIITMIPKPGKQPTEVDAYRPIIPQGSVLGPILYVLYTADIPTSTRLTTSTFADDTAILSRSKCPIQATVQLAHYMVDVKKWLSDYELKCKHVTFTLNRQN